MNNVLEINNITKDYKKFKIDNISFNNYLNPIDIYATSYTWYYKVVDGKLYKRLHNDTSAK